MDLCFGCCFFVVASFFPADAHGKNKGWMLVTFFWFGVLCLGLDLSEENGMDLGWSHEFSV